MKWLTSKTHLVFHTCLAVLVLGIAVVIAVAPLGNERVEYVVDALGMLTWPVLAVYFVAVSVALGARADGRARDWRAYIHPGVAVLLLPFLFALVFVQLPWLARSHHAAALRWQCEGEVVRTYHSSNHQYPAVEIRSADGNSIHVESVYHPTWQILGTGDSVQKDAWDPFALVNGRRVRWVRPGSLDRVRGLEGR